MNSPSSISSEFASLLTSGQSRLYAFILSMVGDSDIALDVLQDTNQALIVKSADFKMGTNFFAWAFQVARFEVLRARQQHQRGKAIVFDEKMVAELGELAQGQTDHAEAELRALRHCLNHLNDRAREVVQARYFNGEPVNRIAQSMGMTPNAASLLLHRARIALMNCIRNRIADSEVSS